MDYQRKIFYTRRRNILAGKDLRTVIEEMLRQVSEQACKTILNPEYPYQCIMEWAKTEFGVDLEIRRIRGQEADYIEELCARRPKKALKTPSLSRSGNTLKTTKTRTHGISVN
jgi:preprotein translocase subunit SecA